MLAWYKISKNDLSLIYFTIVLAKHSSVLWYKVKENKHSLIYSTVKLFTVFCRDNQTLSKVIAEYKA
jgi:hypothetical protein